MPILRLKDIRSMASAERKSKLSELRLELARLKTMIKAGGAVENPARIRELRKAIAQILTVENESKLGIGKQEKQEVKKEVKNKKEKKTK
ncbi:MAG: 50S ribosomal protein L29 [Candidatus Bathyarchaeota archaeon]|nr:50S ribosomal protein L29 [Candidatus Bathyarchaeota archaeon]